MMKKRKFKLPIFKINLRLYLFWFNYLIDFVSFKFVYLDFIKIEILFIHQTYSSHSYIESTICYNYQIFLEYLIRNLSNILYFNYFPYYDYLKYFLIFNLNSIAIMFIIDFFNDHDFIGF